jgi:hypothetical protein
MPVCSSPAQFLQLTGVIDAEVFPLATVLFALGSEVGPHWIVITRSKDNTEDLLSSPQGDRLEQDRKPENQRLSIVSTTLHISKAGCPLIVLKPGTNTVTLTPQSN